MIGRLWRKLTGQGGKTAAAVADAAVNELPSALRAAFAARSFAAIQAEVQSLLRREREALAMLQRLAQGNDWPALEQVKLTAWGHFYRGELSAAFTQAVAYAGGTHDGRVDAPFDADLYMLAVISLFHNHQFEDAWRLLTRLGEREALLADRGEYWSIRSSVAFAVDRIAEAWEASERARHLLPDDALVALNAYALAFRLPDMAVFAQLKREIDAGRYGHELNAFALATPILAMDDYLEGFRLWEGRYGQADAERYVNPALPPAQRFSGRAADWPAGRTLLVSCEQGLGDTIQMARYFAMLAELITRPQERTSTAGRLVIETQPEVLPLLAANFPALHFIAREHGKAPPVDYDFWLGSMSLPYFFATTAATVPGRAGYLTAPAEHRAYWHTRAAELAAGRPRIGLAWSGSPTHRTDRQRSIPFEHIAAAVRRYPDCAFFALQKAVPEGRPPQLYDLSAELLTFGDTAGLIEEMDLVITVDTSAVHLAGALGKPTWLLLPHRYEWRWSLEGEGNRWYDAVRVLRQPRHGDWEAVIDEAFGARLAGFLAQRSC